MLLSPVLQYCKFLDQILPKVGVQVSLPLAPAHKWVHILGGRGVCVHLLLGEIGPLPAAAFSRCQGHCDGEPASAQSDPVAFASFIPTPLTREACVAWSWDASQPSNDTYLHSLKDSQSNPCQGFTNR